MGVLDMSTQNAQLTDFMQPTADDTTEVEDTHERPNWTPHETTTTGQGCQNCDAQVDKETMHVFGDNNDVLHHCFECVTATAMKAGAGVNPDYTNDEQEGVDGDDVFGPEDTASIPAHMGGGL